MLKAIRQKLNKNPLVNFLASTKLAVVLIFFLIIIVVAGTLEQSVTGLYQAREKYFDAYLSFIGPIPIPGTLSILWAMTFNLSLSFLLRFNFTKKNTGLILSHSGLILLFISGFFHFYYSKESFIDIKEAETSSISQSYDDWQLEIKQFDGNFKELETKSISINKLDTRNIEFKNKFNIFIERKYTNAKVFHTPFAGILVKELPLEKEYEKNIPALKLVLNKEEIFLDGDENSFERIFLNGNNLTLSLKRKEFNLPFTIKLLDVERELHPNSMIASSYSSKVAFKDSGIEREAIISMNKPIRSGSYTVYQARYGIDLDGNEFSVLAVVKNLNYQLPYWATFLINFGLILHFIIAFLNYKRKVKA
jgi:cytochrome c biogenesis protein ResB